MTRRLRVAYFNVQPVLVWDDGEDLSPGPSVQPRQLGIAALAELPAAMDAELASLAEQVAADEPTP